MEWRALNLPNLLGVKLTGGLGDRPGENRPSHRKPQIILLNRRFSARFTSIPVPWNGERAWRHPHRVPVSLRLHPSLKIYLEF